MTNMSIQPLWLTQFIEILLVLEFQLTKTYFGTFSYKAHFRPQFSSNENLCLLFMESRSGVLTSHDPSRLIGYLFERPIKYLSFGYGVMICGINLDPYRFMLGSPKIPNRRYIKSVFFPFLLVVPFYLQITVSWMGRTLTPPGVCFRFSSAALPNKYNKCIQSSLLEFLQCG